MWLLLLVFLMLGHRSGLGDDLALSPLQDSIEKYGKTVQHGHITVVDDPLEVPVPTFANDIACRIAPLDEL